MQTKSDSDFSSSGSNSTRQSSVDEQVQQLGEKSVKILAVQELANSCFTYLFHPICQIFELSLLVKYLGPSIIEDYFFVLIITNLFGTLLMDVSKAGAVTAQRNIAKNQVIIANTYFAHAIMLEVIVYIIYLIVGFTVKINTSGLGSNYFVIKAVGGGLCDILGRHMHEFYKVENRNFLMFCQEGISSILYLSLMCLIMSNDKLLKRSMDGVAIAYVISHGILFFWGFFAVLHQKFMDADYRGCLKLSFKRLSPIRPKFLTNIALKAVSYFFQDGGIWISFLCGYLMIRQFQIPARRQTEIMSFVCVYLSSVMIEAFSKGIQDTLTLIANYNVQIKKVTRVYESLKYVFSFGLIYQLAIVLIMALSTFRIWNKWPLNFQNFIFFDCFTKPTYDYQIMEPEVSLSGFTATLVHYLPAITKVAQVMQAVEDLTWVPLVINVCVIGLSAGIMVYFKSALGENPKFYLAYFLQVVLYFCVEVGFLIYYFDKYKKLYKLNAAVSSAAEKKLDTVEQQRQEENGVRASVMDELNQKLEDEEMDKVNRNKSKIQNVFNKSRALQSSRVFISMRDSIRESEVNRESARGSQVRGSQANIRGSNTVLRSSDTFVEGGPKPDKPDEEKDKEAENV